MIGDLPADLLTPQQEEALKAGATMLLDKFFADLGHLEAGGGWDTTDMAMYLPARFAAKYDYLFAKEFVVCLVTVAAKLVQPGNWPLACVAEELALHIIIEEAEAILETRGEEADFGDVRDLAFKDADYEMLYDMAWDGIEDSELGRQMRVANFAFDEWFEPFYENVPVHPYVESGSSFG